MNHINLAKATLLSIGVCLASSAQANYLDMLSETFQSGATFTGYVSFDSNFNATGVEGTLYGYQQGTFGYVGGNASEAIDWLQSAGFNYAGAPISQNFLLDAPAASFDPSTSNSLLFSIDFSNPLAPVFTTGPYDNGINTISSSADFLVSGSIQNVPEPENAILLAVGLAGLGLRLRRKAQ